MSTDIPLGSIGETRKRKTSSNNAENDTNQNNDDAEASLLTGATAGNGFPENFNGYRYKKMLTQGLMNISLFSANANQLRFILEHGSKATAPCYILASFIILSLVLQVGVGVLLLLSSMYKVDKKEERQKAFKYGDKIVIGIFLITAVNIFIVAFGGSIDVKSSGSSPFAIIDSNSTSSTSSAIK